jgi:hypothetical protein
MNKYGEQAMRHWQKYRPKAYAEIPEHEREAFFESLGNETRNEIDALAESIAGPDRPGETYMEKVGRLNMARFSAESDLIREMVLIDPEDEEELGWEPWELELREKHRRELEEEELEEQRRKEKELAEELRQAVERGELPPTSAN